MQNVEKWYSAIQEKSWGAEDYIKELELDDSFGWGKRFQIMCENLDAYKVTGMILTGPEGSGRHHGAYFAIQTLENCGYQTIFLTGRELLRNEADPEMRIGEATAKIEHILKDFRGGVEEADIDDPGDLEGTPLCLMLEELEECEGSRELLQYLGATLRKIQVKKFPPVFLLLIGDENLSVPSILKSQLHSCRMAYPTLRIRAKFLEKNAQAIKNYIDFKTLSQATVDFSFKQLKDLILNLGFLLDQLDEDGETLDSEMLWDFVSQQRGESPAVQPSSQWGGVQLDNMEMNGLLERLLNEVHVRNDYMKGFLDQLPEMIARMGTGGQIIQPVPAPVPAPIPAPEGPVQDLNQERERLENIPVSQLMEEVFGKERSEELRLAAQQAAAQQVV